MSQWFLQYPTRFRQRLSQPPTGTPPGAGTGRCNSPFQATSLSAAHGNQKRLYHVVIRRGFRQRLSQPPTGTWLDGRIWKLERVSGNVSLSRPREPLPGVILVGRAVFQATSLSAAHGNRFVRFRGPGKPVSGNVSLSRPRERDTGGSRRPLARFRQRLSQPPTGTSLRVSPLRYPRVFQATSLSAAHGNVVLRH